MAQITDRQKDSEIIARLIYMAFVAPERANINIGDVSFVPFAAALELYARAAARETASESDAPANAPCDGDSCPVTYLDRPPEGMRYEDVVGVTLPEPPDTHTHTAGANDGEGRAPGSFIGYGSGEKREIFAHLTAFIEQRGRGARKQIADAANGTLTYDDVLAMSQSASVPLSKWRVAEAAMTFIEQGN